MNLTRRTAVLGSAAVVTTSAAGSIAQSVPPTEPLIDLEQQWQEQLAVKHRIPDSAPEEDYEAQCCVIDDIELAIMDTPAHSFAGLAVKLRLVAHYKSISDEGLDWEGRTVLSALRDVERLAGEVPS